MQRNRICIYCQQEHKRTAAMESSVAVLQQLEHRATLWPRNSIPRYICIEKVCQLDMVVHVLIPALRRLTVNLRPAWVTKWIQVQSDYTMRPCLKKRLKKIEKKKEGAKERYIYTKTCTQIFIAALFILVKMWR